MGDHCKVLATPLAGVAAVAAPAGAAVAAGATIEGAAGATVAASAGVASGLAVVGAMGVAVGGIAVCGLKMYQCARGFNSFPQQTEETDSIISFDILAD